MGEIIADKEGNSERSEEGFKICDTDKDLWECYQIQWDPQVSSSIGRNLTYCPSYTPFLDST